MVTQNLRNAFPEKSEQEIRQIRDKFYKHLCDLFLETFKTLTISKKKMLAHCSFDSESLTLVNKLYTEQKSAILVMGHLGNWEWGGNTFSLSCQQQLYVIYHPLTNRYFNTFTYNMRGRFGTKLIAMKDTFREMVKLRNEVNATAFIADQAPNPHNAHWMTFLHQDTPVFLGTEKIAEKMKYPILYISIRKVKRGYYKLFAEEIILPATTEPGTITELHTRILEKDIQSQPENWLWSHRRWKHKRPVVTSAL